MIKRLTNNNAYIITTKHARYCVTLERIKNDINGNRRRKAQIITLELFNETIGGLDRYCTVWTFTSQGVGDIKDCEYIVKHFEKPIYND